MLGRPIRKFRSQLFARRGCEQIARSGRYRAYALQYGRYCYVTRLTSRKFTRYGRSVSKRLGVLKVFVRTRGRISNKYYVVKVLCGFHFATRMLAEKETVNQNWCTALKITACGSQHCPLKPFSQLKNLVTRSTFKLSCPRLKQRERLKTKKITFFTFQVL